jgi:outer membrane lipoprotein carrier protein
MALRNMRSTLAVSAIIVALAATALGQTTARQAADVVDRHYNSLTTLEADFTESYAGAGVHRSETGKLWLKRPGRMRWEYHQPREKLFVTDGHTAWFYVPGERQARRAPLKKLDDLRSPLAYLLGRTKLEKEFGGLSLAPDVAPDAAGNVVLRGVPRHMPGITQVILEVTPDGRFNRIEVQSEDGSSTSFRFGNQRENAPIPDTRFHFSPPAGVETIETDQLSN